MVKRNATGISVLLLLLVALLVAFLLMKNMSSTQKDSEESKSKEDYVQQAQDLVNQINQAQQQAATEP